MFSRKLSSISLCARFLTFLFKFAKHELKKGQQQQHICFIIREIEKNLFGTRDVQYNFMFLQYTFFPQRFPNRKLLALSHCVFLPSIAVCSRFFSLRANLISAVFFFLPVFVFFFLAVQGIENVQFKSHFRDFQEEKRVLEIFKKFCHKSFREITRSSCYIKIL